MQWTKGLRPFALAKGLPTPATLLLASIIRYWVVPVLFLWPCSQVPLVILFRRMDNEFDDKVSFGRITMSKKDIFVQIHAKAFFLICALLLTGLTIAADYDPSLSIPALPFDKTIQVRISKFSKS